MNFEIRLEKKSYRYIWLEGYDLIINEFLFQDWVDDPILKEEQGHCADNISSKILVFKKMGREIEI